MRNACSAAYQSSGPTQATRSLPMKLWTDFGMDMARINSTILCPLAQGVTATVSSLLTSLWNLLMACSSLRAIWWKSWCVLVVRDGWVRVPGQCGVRRALAPLVSTCCEREECHKECQLWPRSSHLDGAARYERLEGQLLHCLWVCSAAVRVGGWFVWCGCAQCKTALLTT